MAFVLGIFLLKVVVAKFETYNTNHSQRFLSCFLFGNPLKCFAEKFCISYRIFFPKVRSVPIFKELKKRQCYSLKQKLKKVMGVANWIR